MAKCPHCGVEVGEHLSFCPGCGKYVETEQSRPAPLDRDDEVPDWYGWLAVLSLSVPIVGLVFLCWWGYRRGRRDALVRPSRALPSYNMENLTLGWGAAMLIPVLNWYALVHLPTLWYKEGLRVGSLGGNPPERFTSTMAVISPIVLAAALLWGLVAAGGTIASSKGSSGSGEPSTGEWVSACAEVCAEEETQSWREYCDCFCRGLSQYYSIDEIEAMSETWATPESVFPPKVQEVGDKCIAGWKGPYPEFVRQEWLDECSRVLGGGNQEYCECVLGQFERRFSYSEYNEINRKFQQEPGYERPPEMAAAVAACPKE